MQKNGRDKDDGIAVSKELTLTTPQVFKGSRLTVKLRKVSRLLLYDAGRKIKKPPVPVMWDEDKDRNEENPDDPAYVEACREADAERGMAVVVAALALGTSPVEPLPSDLEHYSTEEWLGVMDALHIDVPRDNPALRYAAWLRYIALDGDEFDELFRQVLRYSGITVEQDVATASDAFRDNQDGDTVTAMVPATTGERRNPD